jgi:transposase-like protein
MDLKEQIIKEYLEQGCGYRMLQAKYGISRTTICKWVQIYQGVHGLERTYKQQSHYLRGMDVAEDKKGEKIFMLAQSYMPAQDIHIVKNLHNPELSPWFELSSGEDIITPERKFTIKQLRTW